MIRADLVFAAQPKVPGNARGDRDLMDPAVNVHR
jgi:hypothetical protein